MPVNLIQGENTEFNLDGNDLTVSAVLLSSKTFSSEIIVDKHDALINHDQAAPISFTFNPNGSIAGYTENVVVVASTDDISFSQDFNIVSGVIVPSVTNLIQFYYPKSGDKCFVTISQPGSLNLVAPTFSQAASSEDRLDAIWLTFDQKVVYTDETGISITGTNAPAITGISQAGSNVIRLDIDRNLTNTESLTVSIDDTNKILNDQNLNVDAASVPLTNNITGLSLTECFAPDNETYISLANGTIPVQDMNLSFSYRLETNSITGTEYFPVLSYSGNYGVDQVRFEVRLMVTSSGVRFEILSKNLNGPPGNFNHYYRTDNQINNDTNWHTVSINMQDNINQPPFIEVDNSGSFEAMTTFDALGNFRTLGHFAAVPLDQPLLSINALFMNGTFFNIQNGWRITRVAVFNTLLDDSQRDEVFDIATYPDLRLTSFGANLVMLLNMSNTVDDLISTVAPILIGSAEVFEEDVPS